MTSSNVEHPIPDGTASSWGGIGPIRRRRGEIVPQEDLLDTFPSVNTRANNFRWSARMYLLTWSQIGDLSNEALEEKMQEFGNNLKSKHLL